MANLSIHSEYEGQTEVVLGDGTGLQIAHIGSTTLSSPSRSLMLKETLHVPLIHKNLIFVHKFTHDNNVTIEFHPFFYLVKDWMMGAVLMRGRCENGVYPVALQSSSPQANQIHLVGTRVTFDCWHHWLGHPTPKILSSLLQSHDLPIASSKSTLSCISCQYNKSHKLPFSSTSLKNTIPLEFLYADVWRPSPVSSIDGYHYYLLLVDHFTKYCWFYPLRHKSDVHSTFVQFTTMVKNQFSCKLKNLYSDNGGEFIKLRSFLTTRDISHYTTAPHTPQQNGTVERRHRHVVGTGMTLLHHALVSSTYWTYALATAVYLINRLPTSLLSYKSPFEALFGRTPNYHKSRTFGCQCYPWLVPYRTNKLQPKSQPCVFLGYSLTQHAFKCLDLHTGKLYLSRHVTFDEHLFPFKNAPPHVQVSVPTTSPAIFSSPSLVSPVRLAASNCSPHTPPALETLATFNPISDPGLTLLTTLQSFPSIESSLPAVPIPPRRTHPMVTRAQNNIFYPKQLSVTTKHPLASPLEPTYTSQALKDP